MLRCLPVLLALWLIALLACGQAVGQQVAIGGWALHVPYQQGRAVADAGDRVYVAAERGLFFYDKEFAATETLSKIDGLREQQISSIRYHEATGTLVIAYTNTQIDLLQGDKITNISAIFRTNMAGVKAIHAISMHDKLAYLSTSFGVVVLDLTKQEIKDTYRNLGPDGAAVNVYASAILRDSMYLATDLGLLAAQRTGANLQDFRSWRSLDGGLPARASAVAAFNDKLYAATPDSGVYALQGGSWRQTPLAGGAGVLAIYPSATHLTITTNAGLIWLNKAGTVSSFSHPLLKAPREAVVSGEGLVWAADGAGGLIKINPQAAQAEAIAPDGPFSSQAFGVYTYGGKTYVLSGGYDADYAPQGRQDGFYVFADGTWEGHNNALNPQLPFALGPDLVRAAYHPEARKLYLAGYGSGLIEWESPEKGKVYHQGNSPLRPTLTAGKETAFVPLTDLAIDADGNVWVVNRHQRSGEPGLHVLKMDGNWSSFVLPGLADGGNLEHILVDDSGFKWLSIAKRGNQRNGLVVFDEQSKQVRHLATGEGNGNLPDGAVYALAKDLNGDVWVGTASGVGVFYNPGSVFSSQTFDAQKPIIDQRPLLDGQVVHSIAVDGANRKWIGTDNGLWLFSADGDQLLRHFTTQNSPLPSDKVLSVGVEHQTGNVWLATDAGIASYRAEATITEKEPSCAMVFPNPVRRDYIGLIGVSGLPNNADVRITDLAGTLVYKTRATGGTLAWDGRDYKGRRVKAGVYLVLSASPEVNGATCISKIAVLE